MLKREVVELTERLQLVQKSSRELELDNEKLAFKVSGTECGVSQNALITIFFRYLIFISTLVYENTLVTVLMKLILRYSCQRLSLS